ncbi:MAG TPA: SIS domain-containing protein [Polyangiaceae bacterium]|jgi:D-sedoheptulose 7-phosphate isomerase|nr:SIS domain-containing protein [Polyangiaceae bacterium]
MIELRKSTPPAAPEREPASSPRASVRPLGCLGAAKAELERSAGEGTIQVLALDVDGVLTDGRVSLGHAGEETKGILFRDLDAITVARSKGIRIALVTGEDGPLVDAIARRVCPECVLRGRKDKHAALHELSDRMGVPIHEICFVGDADRDAAAFGCVGLGLTPLDGSARARAEAHQILDAKGGEGAVASAVTILLRRLDDATHARSFETSLRRIAEDSLDAHRRFIEESPVVLGEISAAFVRAIRSGKKVLFCGNGGSAADAQHVAGELMGRFLIEREPWPAIALTTDTSILTAVGNDWAFDDVFARQVRALARPGDIVVGITTSGKSPNVLRALDDAKAKGAIRVGFTGMRGSVLAEHTDLCFRAPALDTPRIQELHILAWHSICEVVEAALVRTPS